MNTSTNYGFNLPTREDYVKTSDLTDNFAELDAVILPLSEITEGSPKRSVNGEAVIEYTEQFAEQIEQNADDIADIQENYAKNDGVYENMTVGNAEQLVASVGVTDKTPYLFRTAGGTADIGNRAEDMLVGGTVAWNQLIQNGDFGDGASGWTGSNATIAASDGALTCTSTGADTASSFFGCVVSANIMSGHKFLVLADTDLSGISNGTVTDHMFSLNSGSVWRHIYSDDFGFVFAADADYTRMVFRVRGSGFTSSDSFVISNVMLFDLTKMFGAAVADYVYSLEQSDPGAGAAWFKRLFGKPYYAYNGGELISVNTSAHKMVGFNALDPDSNTAKAVGGMRYQITGAYTALSLDGAAVTPDGGGYFTPAESGTLTVTGGGADTCVHLVWSGSRDGEYGRYIERTYPLDPSVTLRGTPGIDVNGNFYYDGDTYESDGTVTRRYGAVDLGSLSYSRVASRDDPNIYYFITPSGAVPRGELPNGNNSVCKAISVAYLPATANAVYIGSAADKTIAVTNNGSIEIRDDAYTTASALKTALSGVYLIYELAAPTVETAEPFANPQIVDDFGTEEYVDDRAVPIPVGHLTKYLANLRDKLQHLPDMAGADGDYIVRQTGAMMSLVPHVGALPAAPSADGEYLLKCTVSGGVVTFSWEVKE